MKTPTNRGRSAIFAAGIILLSCPLLEAQLRIYQDESVFFANAGFVSTETFDEFPASVDFFPGPSIQIAGVNYTAIDNPRNSWVVGPYTSDWPGHSFPNALHNQSTRSESLTFALGPVPSVGFWLGAPFARSEYSLSILEANGATTPVEVRFPGPNPLNQQLEYFGFVSDAGIRQIIVTEKQTPDGLTSNWLFDDVSVGVAVPEPSITSLAVLAVGFLALPRLLPRLKRAASRPS